MTKLLTYRLKPFQLIWIMLFSMLAGQLQAQGLERQVIGAVGGFVSNNDFSVSSTVGEPVVINVLTNDYYLGQGFQQANFIDADPVTVADPIIMNETCDGAGNGSINIDDIQGCGGSYQLSWNTGDTGTTITELSSGNYTVTITGSGNCQPGVFTFFVDLDDPQPCELKIWSGLTPNGDGDNDRWVIDNIEFFNTRKVSIFSRWGDPVWNNDNYDNFTNVWEGTRKNGQDLPEGTYFYIVEIEGRLFKGWVELTR